MMMSARSRVSVIARHLNTAALTENILFPVLKVAPMEVSGYTIRVDVHHDDRIIDFFTEDMCPSEKINVYLRQKRMMREMYPEYIITEKHK